MSKNYGIVPLADQLTMTGMQFVHGLVDGSVPLNPLARTLCYDVVEAEDGRVVVTACTSAEQLNPSGTVHGGVAAVLLDTCMGLAIRTRVERGKSSTGLLP